jgi:ABC-type transport system involved in multi-copper enzyme maturation permease subunit
VTNSHTFAASLLAASAHVHRRGGAHIFGGLLLLIIVVVVVILLVQRSRNRRPIAEGTPSALVHSAPVEQEGGVAPAVTMTAVALDMAPPSGRYNVIDLARSEWTKMRTVRSTMWTLIITVVLGLGVSAIATAETRAHWSTMSPPSIHSFDPTALSLIGTFIAEFAIGVLGVLVMSAEYSTGTMRAVLSAAPRRLDVLLAKILVFTAVAVIVAEFVSFTSFFLGQALLTSPAIHATLSSPGALRAVVGCGLYVATLGLIGLGLATIIRHSAGAISCFVGILLVLPLIVAALPTSLGMDVRKFLPDRIGAVMITTNGGFNNTVYFSPWVGLLLLVGYAVAFNVIGAILLTRRDA